MTLGITSIQRDRSPWIKEWVLFHSQVGFDKFYIYLHKCSDDTKGVLEGLRPKLDIVITEVGPDVPAPQLKCYTDAYERFGNEVDWMAFIDGDEFLFPTSADNMQEALKEFEHKDISALGVYWACFGSNGHIKEPQGLIIENYRRRADDAYENNRHVKSIVRGRLGAVVSPADPHFFDTPHGTFDEKMRPITTGWTNYLPSYDKFRINHYVTQSREYYLNYKKHCGTADANPVQIRDKGWWLEHDVNDIDDTSMDQFIPRLTNMLRGIT